MTFTEQDIDNLLDALGEWYEVVGAKELETSEIGINDERYHSLIQKLKQERNKQ